MNPADLAALVGRTAAIVLVIAVLAELLARLGGGVLLMLRRRAPALRANQPWPVPPGPSGPPAPPGRDLEEFGIAVLLGWPVLGIGLLGLALAGLFSPPVLVTFSLALLAGSPTMWRKRLLLAGAGRDARRLGAAGPAVLGLGLVPVVLAATRPEGGLDAWMLHLGAPWQYLAAGRAVLENCRFSFHFPLTVEMAFSLPVALEDDRLAKALVALCFLAAAAVLAGSSLRADDRRAGWLGPVLALGSAQTLALLMISKQDIPAAALFVAGALLHLNGARASGALLLGLCVAAKIAFGPLVALWGIGFGPWRRQPRLAEENCWRRQPRLAEENCWRRRAEFGPGWPAAWWLALVVVPVLPWWIKAWLATGNPVYPTADRVFPSLHWGAANWEAFALYMRTLVPAWPVPPSGLPLVWLTELARTHLLLVLVLPGMLFFSRRRLAVALAVAGQVIVFGLSQVDRYLLPSAWLVYFLGARELSRFPAIRARVAAGVLAGYSLLAVWIPRTDPRHWEGVLAPAAEHEVRERSTFLEAREMLRRNGIGEAAWVPRSVRPERVLSVGEWRTYRFPGRQLVDGVFGETPLVWRLVRESRDAEELRKKLRQLGVRHVLFNYVTMEWMALRYDPFPWRKRDLDLYRDFLKQHLEIRDHTSRCDFINGGFYLYEVRTRPRPVPLRELFYLPGAAAAWHEVGKLKSAGEFGEAAVRLRDMIRRDPDALFLRAELGYCLSQTREWEECYRVLKPVVASGMMHSTAPPTYGFAASKVGRQDEAYRVLTACLETHPGQEDWLKVALGSVRYAQALEHAQANLGGPAGSLLAEARSWLEFVPRSEDPAIEKRRREGLAFVLGLQADVMAARGETAEAVRLFRRAAELAPELPGADKWRKRADQLGRSYNVAP